MTKLARTLSLTVPLVCLGAAPAFAHAGHGLHVHSFAAGVMHPLTGMDHLLAMLALGLWAGGSRVRRPLLWLGMFALALVAGFLSGNFGLGIPMVEPMILASVLVGGMLAAMAVNLNPVVTGGVIALFALFHGHAHGVEAVTGGEAAFMAGFLVASLAIASLAYGAAHLLSRTGTTVPRVIGGGVVAVGVALGLAS